MQEFAASEIIVKIQRGQIMRKMESSSLAGFVRMAEKFWRGSVRNSRNGNLRTLAARRLGER